MYRDMTRARRFVELTMLVLLAFWSIAAIAQEAGGDPVTTYSETPDKASMVLGVYHLQQLSAAGAAMTLQSLLPGSKINAIAQSESKLVVFATRDTHELVEQLLLELDSDQSPAEEKILKLLPRKAKARTDKVLLRTISAVVPDLMVSSDDDRNVLILYGTQASFDAAIGVVVMLDGVVDVSPQVAEPLGMLRFIWLTTQGRTESSGNLMTNDLARAVDPLRRVGIEQLRVVAQAVVYVGVNQEQLNAEWRGIDNRELVPEQATRGLWFVEKIGARTSS